MRRSVVLAVALGLDLVAGELPPRLHPVVWFGRLVSALERRAPRGSARVELAAGIATVACSLGVAFVASLGADRALTALDGRGTGRGRSKRRPYTGGRAVTALDGRGTGRGRSKRRPYTGGRAVTALDGRGRLAGILAEAWLLKTTLAVRALAEAAQAVQRPLDRSDLDAARGALRSLVSRETGSLSAPLVAAAVVESVGENASDGIVAPALAYLAFGLPGAGVYRGLNTLDAMLGYHGAFEWLGKAAARLDDVANWLPARLTAGLFVLAAAIRRGAGRQAWQVLRRDHGLTASPNAGWPMSAMAGALGVELEKVGHYRLGAPARLPAARDVGEAVALMRLAVGLGLGIVALVEVARVARKQRPFLGRNGGS